MKNNALMILLVFSLLNACKKDVYVGKNPYAGAKPPLDVKIKTVTAINQVLAGSVFHLSGSGFAQYKDSGMIVKFNDVPGEIVAVSDSSIDVKVPDLASSGLVTLTIQAQIFPGPKVRIKGSIYLDPNFISVPGASGNIKCISVLSGGKYVLGGSFEDYGNSGEKDGYKGIVSLQADGSLDPTFKVGKGFNGAVDALAVQASGKIIAGGNFMDYNERYNDNPIFIQNIVRLNANGSMDSMALTTQAGNQIIIPTLNAYFDGGVTKILQSPIDGKLTVFGNFNYFIRKDFSKSTVDGLRDTVILDSVRMEGAVRLLENGGFDSTFNYNSAAHKSLAGLNGPLSEALFLNNGQILLAGNFTRYHGQSVNGLLVLDSLGNSDGTFNIGTGPNDRVTAVGLLSSGQILVGGLFTAFNGKEARRLVLLNDDGSLATTFTVGSGATAGSDAQINNIIELKNKKLLLTGGFDYFSGVNRKGTVILEPDGSVSKDYNNLGALITNNFNSVGGVNQLISVPNNNAVIMVGSFTSYDLETLGHIVQIRY